MPGRALHGSLRDFKGAAGPAEQRLGGPEEERGGEGGRHDTVRVSIAPGRQRPAQSKSPRNNREMSLRLLLKAKVKK